MSSIVKGEKKGLFLSYKSIFTVGLILIMVLLLVTVIMQNMGSIPVKFLFLEGSAPVIVVISVSALAGAVIGAAVRRFFIRKK